MTKAAEKAARALFDSGFIVRIPSAWNAEELVPNYAQLIDRECRLKELLAVARAAQERSLAEDEILRAFVNNDDQRVLEAKEREEKAEQAVRVALTALPDLKELE